MKFCFHKINLRQLICCMSVLWFAGLGLAIEPNEPGHWIAVTPAGLRKAIEPLCDYRRQEGFDVFVVETEDIYKSKVPSVGNAQAIRDYLHARYTELKGPVYVLLVGAIQRPDRANENTLPTVPGQLGRMKNRPCDIRYVVDTDLKSPKAALGRLPGRNPEEIEQMVEKILRYEQSTPAGPWKYRLSIMAGNPGGQTLMQKNLSGMFVQMMGRDRLSRINPLWCVEGFIHVSGSEFYVPNDQLPLRAKSIIQKGQAFSAYLGHSSPTGLWSDGIAFLNQEDWVNLNISNQQGVFFTCGCYACAIGPSGMPDGYALTAMRNPQGPAAVIGAYGESYAAIGQLAFDGILECLSRANPPHRLGDYWKSVQNGIAAGPMEPMTFMLYDYADGSRGTTTLKFQRVEHLEMWMLLGDPAMRIPLPATDVKFSMVELDKFAQTVQIKGTVPAYFENGFVQLTLEKTLRKPKEPSAAGENAQGSSPPWTGVTGYANGAYVLDQTEATVKKGVFSGQLKLPEITALAEIIVRAYITNGDQDAMNIKILDMPINL